MAPPTLRVVVDTNALVSRLLIPDSVPARAVRKAVDQAELLMSEATLDELTNVLARPKFDPYVTVNERQEFIRLLARIVTLVPVIHPVQVCRDSRDDKFLALAVSGEANVIITGDRDLLVLNPFRNIPIQTPADHIAT